MQMWVLQSVMLWGLESSWPRFFTVLLAKNQDRFFHAQEKMYLPASRACMTLLTWFLRHLACKKTQLCDIVVLCFLPDQRHRSGQQVADRMRVSAEERPRFSQPLSDEGGSSSSSPVISSLAPSLAAALWLWGNYDTVTGVTQLQVIWGHFRFLLKLLCPFVKKYIYSNEDCLFVASFVNVFG